jgi:hypothetical protein
MAHFKESSLSKGKFQFEDNLAVFFDTELSWRWDQAMSLEQRKY